MMDMTQKEFLLAPGETAVQCPYNLAHIVTNAKLVGHLDRCQRAYVKECKAQGVSPMMGKCRFNDTHRFYKPEMKLHEERCPDQFKVVETIRYHASEEFTRRNEEEERRRKESSNLHDKDRERSHKNKHRDRERDHDRNHHRSDRGGRDHGGSSKDRGRNFDRYSSFDSKFRRSSSSSSSKKKPTGDPDSIWGSDAEDWEAESAGYTPAYEPLEKLQSEVLLYQPRGLSKSERKQYRMEQRARVTSPPHRGEEEQKDYEEEEPLDVKPFSKMGLAGNSKPKGNSNGVVVGGVGGNVGGVGGNVGGVGGNAGGSVKIKKEPIRNWEDIMVKEEVRPTKVPPPKAVPVPQDLEKEDGECSEDEEAFIGDDPFS